MNDDINVEEIMQKIRENIRRQAAGRLPPDPDTQIVRTLSVSTGLNTDGSLQHDLAYLQTYWDIQNNSYFISSHRPYIGNFLVKGRKLVHGEVRRYVDPIIDKQSGFNKSTVRVLNNLAQKVENINETISIAIKTRDAAISQLESRLETTIHDEALQTISVINTDIEQKMLDLQNAVSVINSNIEQKLYLDLRNAVATINNDIEQKMHLDIRNAVSAINNDIEQKMHLDVRNAVSAINTDIQGKMWLAHILEERIRTAKITEIPTENPPAVTGINYLSFENQFRGLRDEIKNRQKEFLPYFEGCSHVLDIGCGRGEFLEILKEHTIGGKGVDLDPDMVNYCKSHQLDAELGDAVTYLEKLNNDSLDGIFIDQVVEHLEPTYLVRLLSLCYQKLKDEHYIVAETVNPLSLVSFFNFYLDMSHQKPVHPYTLKFLLESSHFKTINLKYYSEIPENAKLRKIYKSDSLNEGEQQLLDDYNYNIDMLNLLLWGPMDYAAIGKK